METESQEALERSERRFAVALGAVALLLASLPLLFGLLSQPVGTRFLGFVTNTDDHMVYSAWMHQARSGQLFFRNLFAVDPQPGLTVHLYFWILGLLSNVFGLIGAAHLGRIVFGVLFLYLQFRFIVRLGLSVHGTKLALALSVFGGGIGYLFWHNFGQQIVLPDKQWLAPLTGGRLPIDVWQPEAFAFPSILTNGLFAVSLCLMLGILLSVLDARKGWKPVATGAACFFLLMNIHSYDVLLMTLVLAAFLAMQTARKDVEGTWVARAVVIGLGAIPPALWFLYVLQQDKVFQARAATETFAPNFLQVAVGLGFLLPLGLYGAMISAADKSRARIGIAIAIAVVIGLAVAARGHGGGYFLSAPVFAVVFLLMAGAAALLATDRPAMNLAIAWALVGLVAIYFPGLFQRKLAMGMAIPWGILAAAAIAHVLVRQERQMRNLATALAILLVCASSLLWIVREQTLITRNVSTTTVHPAFLSPVASRIVDYLNEVPGRKVAVAPPGIPFPDADTAGNPRPDSFLSPYMPDLNPILSGLAGATTYAGHWSETPDYGRRRDRATRIYLLATPIQERNALLEEIRPDYLVVPVPDAFAQIPYADLSSLGEVVVDGSQFRLVKLR